MKASLKQSPVVRSDSELVVLDEPDSSRTRRVALVGQPNVGKSVVFSQLTSKYVTISNFPGTTVEVFRGKAQISGHTFEFLDTPGINGLTSKSEDERVTVAVLEEESPDLIIQIADAKNLRRALLLTAQLSRFQIPMILVLNMMDELEDRGIRLDSEKLSEKLGIPVIETVATTGEGFSGLKKSLTGEQICRTVRQEAEHLYEWVDHLLGEIDYSVTGTGFRARFQTHFFVALSLLGSFLHLENYFGPWLGWPTLQGSLSEALQFLPTLANDAVALLLGSLAPVLIPVLWAIRVDRSFNERFGVWARKFSTGGLILLVTLSLTYQLVGNLGAQVFVELLEEGIFAAYITPFLQQVLPAGILYEFLVGPYGIISMGLAYGVAIVLPVVFTFFVAFSFLEDSGYLPRLSILSDRVLRAMGLHGKAFLPMVLGLGCVTMATMTTRILSSKKERFIATLLLALGVPCSAQLGVVLGITAGLSLQALLIVFGTVFLQLLIVGYALSRIYPGERSSFVLELPPIRFPVLSNILKKTYWRVRWFLREALPLFALGAAILFFLEKLSLLDKIIAGSQPVVSHLLGLPKETAAVFLMGFLRRDYGAAGLFDMSRQGLLTDSQIVVGLVVLTLFVPCIANFFVMIKEQGLRNALLMAVFILAYAVAVGSGLHWLLNVTQISL